MSSRQGASGGAWAALPGTDAEAMTRMPVAQGAASPDNRGDATPMMAQYLEIKRAHPDCLLFYRMGDFYEMFFEDAVKASEALDIALTKRGRHEGEDIPMCGVPVVTAETYLARLIRQGFRVAVADQVEDPAEARKRGAKALVRREVVRIVTPGTLSEDSLLDARRHNYLAALAEAGGGLGLAWLDMSTGDFHATPVTPDRLGSALARVDAGELLMPERLRARPDLRSALQDYEDRVTPLPDPRFDSETARRRLLRFYKVATLDAFGDFGRAEVAAAGALLDYLDLTQKGRLPRLGALRRHRDGGVLEIDPATMRNLELFRTLSGERRGSLIETIDRTKTGAGARLLARRLAEPLTDPAGIASRLDMVDSFVTDAATREKVREALSRCPDLERALSRLSMGRGGPRDLASVRDALARAGELRAVLRDRGLGRPGRLAACAAALEGHDDLAARISQALSPDPPLMARDGGFVAPGFAPALDEQRLLRDEGRRLVAALQGRYVEQTGIGSLKIRHNNVLGYYIEVPAGQAARMPAVGEGPFIHRQTMASAVRYTTVELGDLESRIARAADTALALELEIFDELARAVLACAETLARTAAALAELDLSSGLADLALERRYCRPEVDSSLDIDIEGGRHPVVEGALAAAGQPAFVANDCRLGEGNGADGKRLWLLTGPNMAGKSTFLRQNALIAILAQMGAFVPATRARLGVVDRLFSRVGAADDLARGRSTFMVEMVETAAILNQAGPRALVILDEIGRGTATFDGLSIAWAVVEHVHEVNRCRALFATHYHELTALAAKLPGLGLHTMRVKDWQGTVVFLHEVTAGAADRSYGIHVAELAGLPPAAVARAGEVLRSLESSRETGALTRLADDLPLFAATGKPEESPRDPARVLLDGVSPDALTPKEALELLYRLKEMSKD
jgi:DNA mismatch repair protein MutS